MSSLSQRWQQVQQTVEKFANGRPVQIVAVSKKHSADLIREGYQVGMRHFGESYVQEAVRKQAVLAKDCPEIVWHYVGPVQSRKVKSIARNFDVWHSLASQQHLELLNKVLSANRCRLEKVFLQINISEESTKQGWLPKDLECFAETLRQFPAVTVHGLMAMPAASDSVEELRRYFNAMHELFLDLKNVATPQMVLETLSMGMSQDYPDAIASGANCIRLGTALFGPRPNA